jgi:hypothetical protein
MLSVFRISKYLRGLQVNWRPLTKEDYPCNHAAPILKDVAIHGLDGIQCSPGWPAIIDSGSDRTMIPSSAASHLKLNFAAENLDRTTFTITGSEPAQSALVYVQFSHPDFGKLEPIQVGHLKRSTILLGRDCLKQLLFTLHGPKRQFIIHQNRSSFFLWWLRLMPNKIRHQTRPPE